MTDPVDIRLRLQGHRQVSAGAKTVKRDLGGVDDSLDRVNRSGRRATTTMRGFAGASRRGLSTIGGGLAGLVSAAGGMYAVGRGVSFAAGEYDEAQRVGGQTNAVIRSTGGIANVTRREVEGLAGVLSAKAGIDDEAIQSGANLLLTFKNVRNEAGKGNDVFDQATRTGLDMAVALGTDMRGSAMMLGKALNDPAKGLTRLERSGVSFTQKQKDQITAMQESGNLLGAQKLMLREIDAQFQGSARAQAQPIDRMRVGFGNLAESMAGLAAPTVNRGISAAADAVADLNADLDGIFRRDDLSLEKKLELAVPLVRRNLAPLARELGGVIDDANLDQHLLDAIENGTPLMVDAFAAAAPRAAGAFVNAFQNAGPWGKLITLAFLAHKLGAFRAAGGFAADRFTTAYGTRIRGQRGRFRGMGKGLGMALGAGILLAIPLFADDIADELARLVTNSLDDLPGPLRKLAEERLGINPTGDYSVIPEDIRRGPAPGAPRDPIGPQDIRPRRRPRAGGSSHRASGGSRRPVFAGASSRALAGGSGSSSVSATDIDRIARRLEAAVRDGLSGAEIVLDRRRVGQVLDRHFEDEAALR